MTTRKDRDLCGALGRLIGIDVAADGDTRAIAVALVGANMRLADQAAAN